MNSSTTDESPDHSGSMTGRPEPGHVLPFNPPAKQPAPAGQHPAPSDPFSQEAVRGRLVGATILQAFGLNIPDNFHPFVPVVRNYGEREEMQRHELETECKELNGTLGKLRDELKALPASPLEQLKVCLRDLATWGLLAMYVVMMAPAVIVQAALIQAAERNGSYLVAIGLAFTTLMFGAVCELIVTRAFPRNRRSIAVVLLPVVLLGIGWNIWQVVDLYFQLPATVQQEAVDFTKSAEAQPKSKEKSVGLLYAGTMAFECGGALLILSGLVPRLFRKRALEHEIDHLTRRDRRQRARLAALENRKAAIGSLDRPLQVMSDYLLKR